MTLTTDAPAQTPSADASGPTPSTFDDAPPTAQAEQLTEWGARLDQAVAAIQELPPEQRAIAQDFALALDALSRTALTTMVKRLRSDERGKELLFELVDDPGVRLLLGMHGIIRMPDPEQAERVRAGIGEDGSAPPTPNSRAFFSLDSLFRKAERSAAACGCEGGDCVCGEH